MQVSVIIPTYNGANKLPNILRALAQQTFQDFETIVVVDGSTDNTIDILESGKNWGLKDFKYIVQPNVGRAKVRNRGAAEAKGDLLIFFDDDMMPFEKTVDIHHQFHQTYSNSILVGRSSQKVDTSYPFHDFFLYRHEIEKKWYKNFNSPNFIPVGLGNYVFSTQNLSMPKNLFEQLGRFDERLTDSEDFDLCMRAFRQNVPIYFSYEAVAWHCDFLNIEQYIKRQVQYWHSKKKLAQLRPEYVQMHPISFQNAISPKNWKYYLKSIFIYNSFWKFITHSKAFRKLVPASLRFKIYSFIVDASTRKIMSS
ncbi:MAG: glycosyltransferase [Microscillaceae bacterium]|nr:glycosyltransferase [Microscillaceae bacterium]MDW8460998.1 glycosyltransferase [Cytophagales bacterium]